MSHARSPLFILVALLAWPIAARATTSSCATSSDGTPCSDTCVTVGTCTARVCTPGTLRPNGTPCSTENACTISDQCQAGVCVAGTPVTCPNLSACLIGVCNPRIGCTAKNTCGPDLGAPDLAAADFASSDGAAQAPDLLGVDLCTVPSGSEFFSCDDPPDGFFAQSDAAGADASVEPFHVRGSHVGDCAFGGSQVTGASSLVLLLAMLLLLTRRLRAMR